MRVPKYRVWVNNPTKKKVKKWMFYPGFATFNNEGGESNLHPDVARLIIDNSWTLLADNRRCYLADKDGYITNEHEGNAVLMQNTDFVDMDSNNIFEGDIIGLFYNDNTEYDLGFVAKEKGQWVVFVEGSLTYSFLYNVADYCKVVGNIYENPDMIKGLNVEL